MSTRYAFVFLFVLLLGHVMYAAQGLSFGVYGGAGNVRMTEQNNSISGANAYNASIGVNSALKKIDLGIIPEITAFYDLGGILSSFGIYFKNSLIILRDTSSTAHWDNGTLEQSSRSDFSVFYSALGLRYNIAAENNPSLTGFAGVGAGLCHYYWNTMSEEGYKIDGGWLYKIKKDWSTAIPALDMECGVNWWASNNMGLSIKGGYRLAQGKVMVKTANIYGGTGPAQAEDNVEYTGFFANAGILIKFDDTSGGVKKEQNPGKGGQFPEIAGKLYTEAEDLYNDGMYRQAQEKLMEAQKLAPDSVVINGLKERTDLKLEDEDSAGKVKKLLKEADGFRQKKNFKKARMRYAEILSEDSGNETAKYFLGDFDSRSKELFEEAKSLKAGNKLSESLKKAVQADEYGNDAGINDFIKELRLLTDKKGAINSLFNEGVDSFRKGDYKKAYESWAEVVNLNPEDKEAALNMEKAKKKMEESNGGEKEIQKKAFEEAKKLFEIGKLDEALIKCQYVLRLNPDNEECKKMMEDIKKAQNTDNQDILQKR